MGEEGRHRRDQSGRHVPGARSLACHARHRGRRNEVDLDAVGGAGGRQASRQPDHGGLCGGVGRVGGQSEETGGRRHHDAAVGPFDHVGPCGAGSVERAPHMNGQVPREVVRVGRGETGPPDDAGVVDQGVEASVPPDRPVHERLCPGFGGHVMVVGHGLAASADDLGGGRGSRLGISAVATHGPAEVVDDDSGTPLGEQQRIGAADAASRAGDDRDASLEAELAQAATEASKPRSRASVPPTMAARSSAGRSPSCFAISSLLPRNVPSACG